MVQLAEWQDRFEALGVKVAGMTYDSQEILAEFRAARALNYPLLRDTDVKHFSAYGVLNEEYEPGDGGYGIPHPGILYVGKDGTVLMKFAVPGYRKRPPFSELVEAIEALQAGS